MAANGKTLIAGATGYIGRLLSQELARSGDPPRVMARNPGKARDLADAGCEVVAGDVLRRETLDEPLDGIRCAYYLVHSMGRGGEGDFAERDREGAENFAAVASRAGVERIVYLGGLSDGGSKHLESRHATAGYLGSTGVPVTYLRAAAVIGSGSESFRTVFFLVKRLPVMITPRWTTTRTQPIAIADVIAYLAQARENAAARGRSIEIGGPDVTTYGGMMDAMAAAMDRRPPSKLPVPLLTPYLSSKWIGLVTPVDAEVAKPLIEGASTETVVKDSSGMELFEVSPTPIDEAMRAALAEGEGQGALGGGLAVDGRALGPQRWQLASLERAQVAARDQHVDPQLGLRVDEGAEARDASRSAQEGIEVGDDRAHADPPLAVGARLQASHVEAQVSAAPATGGNQDAALDRPGDPAELGARVVLRLAEAQKVEPAPDQHNRARGAGVRDPQQPQRDPVQVAPVPAREALQVRRGPELVKPLRGHRQLGLLHRAQRPVRGHRPSLGVGQYPHLDRPHVGRGRVISRRWGGSPCRRARGAAS